jgi:predicted alpha/beta hydrolase
VSDRAESIEVRTRDGRSLFADVREPRGALAGTAVLAHAMFARRVEFERPRGKGLARFLAARGWRTVAFDFRGHGESAPRASEGGSWSYDDLARHDLPAVVACARARAEGLPVVVVGHSLGGHVAIASQAAGWLDADAIVGFAANVWMESLEPSRAVWAAKRAILDVVRRVCARRGYFPARLLRLGSDDEATPYFTAFRRFAETGTWGTDDGAVDYGARLGGVGIPVMNIASDGDRINCRPVCAERFLARLGGPTELVHVRRSDDGSRPPGHMALVTTERARSAWVRAAEWMERVGVARAPRVMQQG